MGVQLKWDGDGFLPEIGRKIVSEVIMPGDIQIIGDGTPYVLLSECQTTGGYPRIATVLPCDLPCIAQAPRARRSGSASSPSKKPSKPNAGPPKPSPTCRNAANP